MQSANAAWGLRGGGADGRQMAAVSRRQEEMTEVSRPRELGRTCGLAAAQMTEVSSKDERECINAGAAHCAAPQINALSLFFRVVKQ